MPAVAEAAEELSREAEDLLKSVFVARRIVSFSSCNRSVSLKSESMKVTTVVESRAAAPSSYR